MLVHEILADVAKRKEKFEKKTGVNLDYEKRKQEMFDEQNKLRESVKKGIFSKNFTYFFISLFTLHACENLRPLLLPRPLQI